MTYRCSPRYVTASSPRALYASPDTPSNCNLRVLNPHAVPGEYFATTGMSAGCSLSDGDGALRPCERSARRQRVSDIEHANERIVTSDGEETRVRRVESDVRGGTLDAEIDDDGAIRASRDGRSQVDDALGRLDG